MRPFDSDGKFPRIGEGGELRHLAVRGAGVAVFAQGLALACQIVGTVVLARLLTPADFGVVAMVTTFSLLLGSVGVSGFTEAAIQREELDDASASNLFWITGGAGLVLAVAFAAAGPLLSKLYHDPVVARVALGIAPTILLTNSAQIHLALLKRAMRFSATSANDVCARSASVLVSIIFAWSGFGYWALVAGTAAMSISTLIGAFWRCRWIPSPPRRGTDTGPMVRFAANVYARYCLRYCARNTDNLLVGWRFNAQALGFYKKAYDLFAMSADQLIAPLASVALATLSRLNRDTVQYKRYLTTSLQVIAFIGMAVGTDLALVGSDVIRFLLGPKWAEAGRIFTYFGPGIGMMLLHSCCGWIHLSIGRPDRWLRWTALELVVTGLLFVMALPWGPAGIAIAWSLSFWTLTVPAFWYAGRPIRFGVSPLITAIWKYIAASLLAGGACVWVARHSAFLNAPDSATSALLALILVSLLFTASYVTAVILLHGGFAPIRQFCGLLGELAPSRDSRRRAAIPAFEVR